VDEYTNNGAAASHYAPVIYLLASSRLVCRVVDWCMSASLSVFVRHCLLAETIVGFPIHGQVGVFHCTNTNDLSHFVHFFAQLLLRIL
jgi:hypothetical protein